MRLGETVFITNGYPLNHSVKKSFSTSLQLPEPLLLITNPLAFALSLNKWYSNCRGKWRSSQIEPIEKMALNDIEIRHQIIAVCQRLYQSGLITGSSGNVTLFDRKKGLIAVTGSGAVCQHLDLDDVMIVDKNGNTLSGKGSPTSELAFHLALYRKRADINAIVHTHSTYATTLACLGWELPAVHYLIGFAGKKVPLAPYATFGSEALAHTITETIGDGHALLLANHGLVAVGPTLNDAFRIALEVEFAAKIFYLSKCVGNPVILDDDEMGRVIARLRDYSKP